jgi:hypothetical protein
MTDIAYEAFLQRRGLSPHRVKSREDALSEQLALIERQIERRERTAKHAPSAIDAERIQEKIERLEAQAAQIREALGQHPITWAELADAPAPIRCRSLDCDTPIRDAYEAFSRSGYCQGCFDAWTGRTTTPPSRKGHQ